jgi:hypothetical protein
MRGYKSWEVCSASIGAPTATGPTSRVVVPLSRPIPGTRYRDARALEGEQVRPPKALVAAAPLERLRELLESAEPLD